MSDAGLPGEIGNSLVNAIGKVVETTHKMSEKQLEAYANTEYAKLGRAYGNNLETKLQSAARMVHELETRQPGLKTLLKSKGTGDNAIVVRCWFSRRHDGMSAKAAHRSNKAGL